MNKVTKTILTVCGGLILLGGALVGVSCALGAGETESHEITYTVDEYFTNILVNVTDAEVVVRPSSNGTCYAVCDETEKITYSVQAANGALHVSVQDNRAWYEYIGIHFDVRTVELYLPESAYELLDVTSMSGSITCEESFTFDRVKLESASGLIKFASVATDNLTAKSASGSITLENFGTAQVKAESTSGRILCENGQPTSLTATTSSGSVTLKNVLASGNISIETGSGSIHLDACDGANLTLKSTSGSVRGTLLTEKNFTAKSSSGSIRLPESDNDAGYCKISTTSGSIDIEYQN